jgi:hypothetical protein
VIVKLSVSALIEASRLYLGPEIASALQAATAALQPELPAEARRLADDALGGLLARAVGVHGFVDDVELRCVHLNPGGETIVLSGTDLDGHPLLDGVPATLAEAIAAPLVAGARAHFYAPWAPSFVLITIGESRGVVTGTLEFRVGSADRLLTAVAVYGPVPANHVWLTTQTLSAAALVETGRLARTLTMRGAQQPPPSSGGSPIDLLVVAEGSGAVH